MHHEFHASLIGSLQGKTSNPLRLAGNLIDQFKVALNQYGCEKRDSLIASAKDVYDRLTQIVDIPLVTEPLESQLEQQLYDTYVGPTLEALANTVCGPKHVAE